MKTIHRTHKVKGAVAWEDSLKELKQSRPEVYKALKDPEPLACLAWNLMEIRNRMGLTQKGLADRSGVSLRTVSYIEKYEAGYNPSVEVIQKIAKALGVSFVDMFQNVDMTH